MSTFKGRRATRDNFMTYDQATLDSTGAFLISELQRMDPTIHMPLVDYTWSRDVDVRTDIDAGFESTSFTNSSWASTGGTKPTGKSWVSKGATAVPSVSVDIGQTITPLYGWAEEVSYTVFELMSSQKLGRPIDEQKVYALREKYQMDVDEQVYIGDADLGMTGLVNNASVSVANVTAGVSTSTLWTAKTADEILLDINTAIKNAWLASGYKIAPSKILLPPAQFNYISTTKVSSAMPMSILSYIEQNSICNRINRKPIEIDYCKWLTGRGVSTADRMVAYTQKYDVVRFPLTPLTPLPMQYSGVSMRVPYFCKLGGVEMVRTEAFYYADGI